MWAHDQCTACQTCHAHGATWNEHDWVDDDDDTPCPAGLAIDGGGETMDAVPGSFVLPLNPRDLRAADLDRLRELVSGGDADETGANKRDR